MLHDKNEMLQSVLVLHLAAIFELETSSLGVIVRLPLRIKSEMSLSNRSF